MTILRAMLVTVVLAALDGAAQARFICGATALRNTHSKCGSTLALDWARHCPHTYAHAGAVVVSSRRGMDSSGKHHGGHVALIVAMGADPCHATVKDERGTYERDICRRQVAIVEP